MAQVRVEAFLMCDAVFIDRRANEKVNVQGIFDEVYFDSFPAVYEQNFVVYGRLRLDRPGEIQAEIEVQNPSGARQKIGPPFKMSSGKTHMIGLITPGQRFPMPEAGRYVVSLIVDGKKISDFHVTAVVIGSSVARASHEEGRPGSGPHV